MKNSDTTVTVIPVLHKGENIVHHIEVPANVSAADLRAALLKAGYHVDKEFADAVQNTKQG